jgi:protein TonB
MAKDGEPLKTFDLAAPSPEPVVEVKTVEPQVVVKPPTPRKTSPAVPGVSPPQEARAEPPSPQPTPLVQLAPGELAAADLRSLPSGGESKGKAGPPAPSGGGDSQVVEGSGPNGERLYAAAWQREPSHDELRGYLSTAQPAWAMIACRTVADFRVDDCVAVAEYPRGSQLARAVLAAAWQFRVRPPRIGGQLQVGEWVRIRIDYGLRRRAEWEKARE